MHRQCRIIHTDFKPENVVIGLRDEEVAEIAQTGQLTTTKMFDGHDHNRKLNMKVAGTLPTNTTSKRVTKKAADKKDTEPEIDMQKAMEGMTAKQKKNFRKKQARKRKKAEQSRMTSQLDISKDDKSEKSEADNLDLDINVDVGLKTKEVPKKKQAGS